MSKLTQEVISFIVAKKDDSTNPSYKTIAEEIKTTFGVVVSGQAVGRAYRDYKSTKTKPTKSETVKDTITLTVQVNKNIAEQFKRIAKENDRNQSQLIREWIKKYCLDNNQAKLF